MSAVVSWLFRWIWGLPFVPPLIYGSWAWLRGAWGPDLALGMFGAFVDGVLLVLTIKVYVFVRKFTDLMQTTNPHDGLRPTIEMLEAGRRVAEARHVQRIKEWREMVAYVNHRARTEGVSAIELAESDPRFMSLRPLLTDKTQRALRGEILTQDEGPNAPTIPYALRCILDDVDTLERTWSI